MKSPSEAFEDINPDFIISINRIKDDIDLLSMTANDSLLMGDAIYGKSGDVNISKQVQDRNQELNEKRDKLRDEIYKKDAVIERSNRDFSDNKNSLPEIQPTKKVIVIQDYTMAFLSIAYLFMILSIIYTYSFRPLFSITSLLKSIAAAIFLSFIVCIMLYYIT